MIRNALPGNSNLAIAQAAQTPKARLNGTVMAAVIRVRRTADSASGSLMASSAGPTPCFRASMNTVATGRIRTRARNSRTVARTTALTQGGSLGGQDGLLRGNAVRDAHWKRLVQAWTALITNSMAKDTISRVTAMAAAPR